RHRLEARTVIEFWRQDYNQCRPHSGISYATPASRREEWIKQFGPRWGIKYPKQTRRLSA
ncbi:MAG: integrase core domain-containing protein, partial [Myxococcota bacterium]